MVECTLSQIDPASWSGRELVGEEVRVINAEPGENGVKAIRLAVAIFVPVIADVRAMLSIDAITPRQDAQRDGQSFCKDARLGRFGTIG